MSELGGVQRELTPTSAVAATGSGWRTLLYKEVLRF
jgi:hypothetical protein